MAKIVVKYDCRAPAAISSMNFAELYQAVLEQVAWIDRQDVPVTINFCVHHGAEDGYLPASLSFAAAAAALTRHCRLRINVILPYHDPIRVAEEVAVLDQLSNGRVELLLLGGYVPSEMRMFGIEPQQRGRLMEEGVLALKQAWSGESFDFRGRRCQVRPLPLQQPHPPLIMGGMAPAAARRAARLGDAFEPGLPASYEIYRAECEALNKTPRHEGKLAFAHLFMHEDPEQGWREIAPYALYESNCYARWQASAAQDGMFSEVIDIDTLRASGAYQVASPQQVLATPLDDDHKLLLHPLLSGMPRDMSWRNLELFFQKVAPGIQVHA